MSKLLRAHLDMHRRDMRDRGYTRVAGVLEAGETGGVRAALDSYAASRAAPSAYGRICHEVWLHVPLAGEIIARVLAPLALALLDVDEVVLFQDHLIAKPPGTSSEVKWHQDYSYWPLDSARGLTMWVALDSADRENGCLRYIPDTHKLGERQPADFVAGAEQPARAHLPPLDADPHAHKAEDAPVHAGDVLAHDPLVWHMSPGNLSNRPRHAWSLTWITPYVGWAPEHAPHPYHYLLRPEAGTPILGHRFPRFRAG